jgi:hypothetical protein
MASRPSVADFCSGSSKCRLIAIRANSQGIVETLEDPDALRYLCNQPRKDALPASLEINSGFTFVTELFDRWGRVGRVWLLVDTNQKAIRLTCFKSVLGVEEFSYILISSNAPSSLLQWMTLISNGAEVNRVREITR